MSKQGKLFQNRVEVFDTALLMVTQDRGEIYGDPKESFGKVSLMKVALADCPNAAIRHALEMICLKVVRISQSPDSRSMDSIIDVAGYARTIAMILDKEESNDAK